MVALRATTRLLRYLDPPETVAKPSGGALGDWYANRVVVDRQSLVLLVSSTSLLAIVTTGRDTRTLPARLPALVAQRLRRLGVAPKVIDAEVATLTPAYVARTVDRATLGILVVFSREFPFYLPVGGWDETSLPWIETRLADTPCRASGPAAEVIHPQRRALELLSERWA